MTVILLSVCFIKTCTNPVLLTLWTRFLSYHFIVVFVDSLNSVELIASPSSCLVAFWQLKINEYEWWMTRSRPILLYLCIYIYIYIYVCMCLCIAEQCVLWSVGVDSVDDNTSVIGWWTMFTCITLHLARVCLSTISLHTHYSLLSATSQASTQRFWKS